jgi:hypothetical protein
VDIERVRRLAYESRDYLAARAGSSADPVTAPARREIKDCICTTTSHAAAGNNPPFHT